MQKLKSEKGISLIALGITAAVLMLISVPIIVNVTGVTELAKYSKFKDDIDNLRENISIAFNSENLSAIGPTYEGSLDFLNLEQNGKKVKSANDNNIYYAINISEVNKRLPTGMKELNYGDENSKISDGNIYFGTSDVYIINDASRTIYYVKGITYKDNTFYRLPEDFSSTEYGIKPGEIVTDFNKYFTDKEGNIAKIPVGFKVSDKEDEQVVSKGLVISDKQGNEFVWIPVDSLKNEKGASIEIKFDRYIYGNQVKGDLDNVYQSTRIYNNEGDKNFFYESNKEFELLSVSQNKGFYIARYEAGADETRTDSSTNDKPVVKKGANVYNHIKRNDAKTLAENFIINDNISSRLCSSQAWDTALQFIKQTGNDSYLTDSNSGNYGGTLKATGNTISVNNIFDLGGNVNEWTTELYSDDSLQFTVRGGSIENASSASPASSRIATGDIESENTGFRITLFLSVDYPSGSATKGTARDLNKRLSQSNNSVIGKKVNISNLNLPSTAKAKDYEWQILYADSNHIYLIASNCIKIDDCPATEKSTSSGKYSDFACNFTTISKSDDYKSLSSVNSKVRDLNKDFFDKYINESTINENMKAVLYLLDTKIWEKKFVGENNSKVYFVVGSPSIELLFKAHNAYYGTTLSAKTFSSIGYKISTKESNQENDYLVTSDLLQTNNSAIVLSENDVRGYAKNCDYIWIASPGTRQDTSSIMRLCYNGNISSDDVKGHAEGLRPVICLNSDVQLEENSDGSFSIK